MLLTCPHEHVRIYFQRLVSGVIAALGAYEKSFLLELEKLPSANGAG